MTRRIAALAGLLLVMPAAVPAGPDAPAPAYTCQSALGPGVARLGQPVAYRGRVVVSGPCELRWERPVAAGAFDWGPARARRLPAAGSDPGTGAVGPGDTLQIEATLQVFAPGIVTVPGLAFEIREPAGARHTGRLPSLRLAVVPTVGADDTAAALRPLRGPLGAPWWERVPWPAVGAGALAVALLALGAWRLRRRRPVARPAVARASRSPVAVALEALAALRALRLPEQGRFAEHALRLTAVLRRFLEATGETVRPGDSTPELVAHLEGATLRPADLGRLRELLAAWDRVKFARAPSSAGEARQAETAVEELVRRPAPAAAGEGG